MQQYLLPATSVNEALQLQSWDNWKFKVITTPES